MVRSGLHHAQTNAPGKFFTAFGGDFGDMPNAGGFAIKGLVNAERQIFPKYWEVKKVYQPVTIAPVNLKPGNVALRVLNRNAVLNLSVYEARWSVTGSEGETIQSGVLSPVDCPASNQVEVKIPVQKILRPKPGAEFWLRLSFHTRTQSLWAPAGFEVAWQQLPLAVSSARESLPHQSVSSAISLIENGDVVKIESTNSSATFSRANGTLISLKFGGREMLATNESSGPVLQLFRAPTDNDKGFGKWLARDWREAGLSNLTHHVESFEITGASASAVKLIIVTTNIATVTTTNSATNNLDDAEAGIDTNSVTEGASVTNASSEIVTNTITNFVYRVETAWTIHSDGSIDMENEFSPLSKNLPLLPRMGVAMALANDLENVRWLGRGPWENYPDRKESADMGVWSGTVDDQYVPYVRPQENGNKEDARWVELTDADGGGLKISAVKNPFAFSALHFTANDLASVRHNYELAPRKEIILSLNAKMSGLGNSSCGPGVLEKYAVPPEKYSLKLRFAPAKSR